MLVSVCREGGLPVRALLLTIVLLVGACGSNSTDQVALDWAYTIQPDDPVPDECRTEPQKEPRPDTRQAFDKEKSAIEARKILVWGRGVRQQYVRCQEWAKAQRK